MADGVPITFEQMGGEKRKIALYGWDGPHGRARQGAVLRPAVEVRSSRTRYPGNPDGSAVTRHVFGPEFPDMELKGRFRKGRVQEKVDTWRLFVAEAQTVRVTWGAMMVCEGIIKSFDPGIEAANKNGATEVEWSMKIEVDSYPDLLKKKFVAAKNASPTDYTSAIRSALLKAKAGLDDASFPGDVFDAINAVVDAVSEVVDDLTSVTDGLQDFKNAAFGLLNHIRGVAQKTIRKGQELREFVESSSAEYQQIGDSFNELKTQANAPTVQEQLQEMMSAARDLDEAADRAIIGRTKTTYVAKDGDTWESMASKFYGGPGRANDIRDANLASPGEQVQSGREYLIPV